MGSQTQQTINGSNDVVMAEGGTTGNNSNGGDLQSASKMNGEGGMHESSGAGAGAGADDKKGGAVNGSKQNNGDGPPGNDGNNSQAKAPAATPPPPVLRGTLSYNVDLKRHLIRGMWNYENSNAFPPQRFELLRNLDKDEDPTVLPKDGEFHGSFSLAYFHTTSKGKQKERSKVISESGVKIKFTKIDGEKDNFKVDGKGTNQFGIFHINGTATPTPHGDGQYNIVLRKRYEPSAPTAAAAPPGETPPAGGAQGKKTKKRKISAVKGGENAAPDTDGGPLPPPSQSFEKNVVCLRGKLYKEESEELGVGEIVHRIHGMWSSGLDLILADPQNVRGLCNRFQFEHKSSVPSSAFPVSGRYSGWFDLTVDDGSKQKISEKDVTLRFRKNNAGFHNVEGKGSNAFGKYSITGTLTMDNVITIFRHFQTVKKQTKAPRPVTSAPPPINAPGQSRRPSLPAAPDPQLKLDEVNAPDSGEPVEAVKPPEQSTYSAVSRGVLRLNEDGSHSCQGKWAVTREHFTNGQTSNFAFRLEAHFAGDAQNKSNGRQFPLDSEMYKGSFQLKKGSSRSQTVIDQQIVMKFRKNKGGTYNVYGKGINAIGVFNLTGTLIMSGKTGGQVEVYRMYPPELLASSNSAKTPGAGGTAAVATPSQSIGKTLASDTLPGSENPPVATSLGPSTSTMLPGPPRAGIVRRESTRLTKVPSRLEDDDPKAQLSRIMDKCGVILRFIREKDVERGAFFSEPVDPVALGIPTYYQVISEPMDLRTLHRKMEVGEITTPEEFSRLARLVFENAMTFNVDPTHSVHQAARNLLILFNQKFRDVERMANNLRRTQKGTDDDKKKKGADKKRKKEEEPRSLKRQRLDEAQEMATANSRAMADILAAAPANAADSPVTRQEFNQLLNMMQQLQQQIVQTYTVFADTQSDEIDSGKPATAQKGSAAAAPAPAEAPSQPAVPEKKKTTKKKAEPPKPVEKPPPEEDNRPLTLHEQELLTETINDLPPDHLHGVIQIIREAAKLTGEEDEIDLEIDQLDTVTQRKLLKHVLKFIKQPKRQKAKIPKKVKATPAPIPKKVEKPTPIPKKTTKPPPEKPKTGTSTFLAIGGGDDSDTDSEGEISSPAPAQEAADSGAASGSKSSPKDQFKLGDDYGDEDDGDDDIANGAANWNIAKPTTESDNKGTDEDDAWGAARNEAIASKAREEDKKKREEKMEAEAEQARNRRLADAVNRGEEIKAQRQAEEEEEAKAREQQEKDAEEQRRAAREAAQKQYEAVEQTVDLDAQRIIMQQVEQDFDNEMGSASPSSDFGF